jgi:hypothetical protein
MSTPSSNTIPKGQAYALIGGTLLLVILACALLIGWRLGSWTSPTNEVTASTEPAPAVEAEPSGAPEPVSAAVDNSVLLQRLEGCRPNCAGVDLAFLDIRSSPIPIDNVDFQNANLSGAKLSMRNLWHSNLSGANLSGASFHGGSLKWANFTGANLRGAKLTYTILSAADFTGADLTGADLSNARYDSHTLWPAGFDPEAAGAGQIKLP